MWLQAAGDGDDAHDADIDVDDGDGGDDDGEDGAVVLVRSQTSCLKTPCEDGDIEGVAAACAEGAKLLEGFKNGCLRFSAPR